MSADVPMRRALRFLPAIAWAGLIFGLSAQPRLPEPPLVFAGLDKLAHAAVYAALAWLLLFADQARQPRRALLWVLVAGLYGLTDELHQSFVPSRSADGWDLLADFAGAAFAGAAWSWWRSRRPAPGAEVAR